MIIEDADRMTERTSNVLLKALEEPPPRTVWILCAPSEADLIPTIRSRVRTVRLRVPGVEEVAELISRRDGVSLPEATRAAREAQSHIGMAHRLATNEERPRAPAPHAGTRARHPERLRARSSRPAELLQVAGDDAKAITEERDAEERDRRLRSLGIEPGGTVPLGLRAQLKALEEDQKRRATRSLRDGLDRILVDLSRSTATSCLLQLGVGSRAGEPGDLLRARPSRSRAASPAQTLATLDAIAVARQRIEGNVNPALALEAMLVSAIRDPSAADARGDRAR